MRRHVLCLRPAPSTVVRGNFQLAARSTVQQHLNNRICLSPFRPACRIFAMSALSDSSSTSSTTALSVVYLTVPSQSVAEQLSEQLVQQHVVACVSIVPAIQSVYRWESAVCRDNEVLLMCKTRQSLVPRVAEAARALKYAECPEVIATPIVAGTNDYLQWVADNTKEAIDK